MSIVNDVSRSKGVSMGRTEAPIRDFIRHYADAGTVRLHMPGHKGRSFLGCEALDITEVSGTEGLIRDSEERAAALFGSARTCYAAGGSSQCVRAMVYLAVTAARAVGRRPVILAARNAHKSFLYACALCDAEPRWLYPETRSSLCGGSVTPDALRRALDRTPAPPAAVYVTSPDYLGGTADLRGLSAVCREHGVPLMVDNAHGAYLRFLDPSRHPLDLGADLCCDSAHKTLPVLTGGAYLHVSRTAPAFFRENAGDALDLFGTTSPSWLVLASLDRCNRVLSEGYRERLERTVERAARLRDRLRTAGWQVEDSDPLRVTLRGDGLAMAQTLRRNGIECEYADRDYLVLMLSTENTPEELDWTAEALGVNHAPVPPMPVLPSARGEAVLSPRQALFAPQERVPVSAAVGRVCGAPAVSCPPAVPAAVSGERIGPEAARLMEYYGMDTVHVVRAGFDR